MTTRRPGRPPDEVPSVRLRFGDGFIKLGQDPQVDALYERIQGLSRGTKFRTVMTWLLTGAMMETAIPENDAAEIRRAAEDIMAAFVVE